MAGIFQPCLITGGFPRNCGCSQKRKNKKLPSLVGGAITPVVGDLQSPFMGLQNG